jgi:uncharacterized membrane protein YoaK (UPF0700 family)
VILRRSARALVPLPNPGGELKGATIATGGEEIRKGARFLASQNALLLSLAGAAGCIDALSYLGLGQVFTANMTGNTVLLGVALCRARWWAVARSGAALVGFLTGLPDAEGRTLRSWHR